MENKARLLGSKKSKWIISISAVLIGIISVFAVWELLINKPDSLTCKVEYIKEIGDVIVQTYLKGEKLSFPDTPTKNGYDFVGWSLDENENNFVTSEIVVEKELTLYAKWQEKEYELWFNDLKLTIDHNTSIYLSGNNVCVDNGELTTITPPQTQNKQFDKWVVIDSNNIVDFADFKLEDATSSILTLQPIYKDIYVTYSIVGDLSNLTINSISKSGLVTLANTLSFEIELGDSVSNSNLVITTDRGNVESFKENNIYYVTIYNHTSNFNIYINNITTNSYTINYVLEDSIKSYNQLYGDTIIFPALSKVGYTLTGFKDELGNIYSNTYKVTSNLTLYPIWEPNVYTVELPKSNGMYVITYNGGEYLTNGKTLSLNHGDSLSFEITLSRAYNNSNIEVVGVTQTETIYPTSTNNVFTFSEVTNNLTILVNNVTLNSYTLSVDGKTIKNIGYGSWIEVKDNNIVVTNTITNNSVTFNTLISDDNFGGWILNGSEVLTNSFIQDIAVLNTATINGNYSKEITRIQLVLNGGTSSVTEIILVDNQTLTLPTPTKNGYEFAGWFTTLVEVNTIVDETQSEQFNGITQTGGTIVLFAGWKLEN